MTQPDTGQHAGRNESPHFDEMTGLLLLEQQLDDEHAKAVTEHANTCASCRELLRVLKNEAVWLRGALTADDEPIPARLIAAPARGGMTWGWLAAFGFGAAGAYTLWNGLVEPWMTRASDMGLTQGNLMTWLFFSGAFWSGWSDVRNGIEFMAFVTLGGLAVWALRRAFRKQARVAVAAIVGMLVCAVLPFSARAADTEHGTPGYTLAAGQEVKNDLIVTGADHAQIDGTVDGDLIVFARDVEVNGHVTGDILDFSQELRMNGTVDGNVRVCSHSVIVNGTIGKNLMILGHTLEVGEKSKSGGSTTVLAQDAELDGSSHGDLLALAGQVEMEGQIGGDAKIRAGNLTIGPTAQVMGRIKFTGPNQPEVASGAKLGAPIEVTVQRMTPDYTTWTFYLHAMFKWGAAFLLGMVWFLLAPGIFIDATQAANKAGLSMGIGLLFLVGVPVASFIACVTIVGLGLGIVTFLIYIVAVYASQIFVGAWLGEKLLGTGIGIGPVLARLALGLAILRVIRMIPFAGWFSIWVVIVWGLGAYVLAVHKRTRHQVVAA